MQGCSCECASLATACCAWWRDGPCKEEYRRYICGQHNTADVTKEAPTGCPHRHMHHAHPSSPTSPMPQCKSRCLPRGYVCPRLAVRPVEDRIPHSPRRRPRDAAAVHDIHPLVPELLGDARLHLPRGGLVHGGVLQHGLEPSHERTPRPESTGVRHDACMDVLCYSRIRSPGAPVMQRVDRVPLMMAQRRVGSQNGQSLAACKHTKAKYNLVSLCVVGKHRCYDKCEYNLITHPARRTFSSCRCPGSQRPP